MTGPIAIIGAAGFVGTRLIETLVLDGAKDVRAVVRAYRSMASLARFGPALKVNVADAANVATLTPALRGAAVVVNLTTGAPSSIVPTTKAILAACVAAKVDRLIHLSSAVVYGEVATPSLSDDAPPVRGHWMPYARAKADAEIWLRSQIGAVPCQVAVLRPGIVWGVRSPHTMNVIQSLLAKNAYLVDSGNGVFNAIYIDNLVAGIRACCSHIAGVTGFYNVADRETVTWREFYSALAAACDYDMERIPNVPGDRFPWSTGALLDYVQSLPLVNGLYHRLKSQLPDGIKPRIKALLAGPYNYETTALTYALHPRVDRELWHLQKVQHKLPAQKFSRHFGFVPPVSFAEGIRKTLSWLAFLGYHSDQAVYASNQ